MSRTKPLDGELLRIRDEIHGYAKEFGLDFYEVRFEVCDYDTINILAAQGGFPSRYPHWRFGMDYDQLSKGYAYGLQKIYEMVINTNPCYAYLLNANHLVDQKIVMAHVYGHADFFKNNAWFANTDRNMLAVMANHGTKIRRYMERYGQNRVEEFIDRVNSIENLIDVGMLFETPESRRQSEERMKVAREEIANLSDDRSNALKSFMRSKDRKEGSAPQQVIEESADLREKKINYPRDIMHYLLENAPLEEWEADILGILRDEAYYYLPQRLTKIMNEGWASYWHSHIMTTRALKASEIIDYADHHAGVMAMSRQNINPYKIGIELYRDIEYRWNTGRFGKEYNECEDMHLKANWDKKLGLGRQKIFEVRRTHNDVSFIDEFFTPEFCERQQLFTYKFNPRTGRNEIETRDFMDIKNKLLSSLSNFGSPVIEIESGNYQNRGELLLRHVHRGVDLDFGYASDTLKNLYALWKRPVNITSRQEEQNITLSFDGKEFKQTK
ncbi:SpoVR family protein [Bacteriovorax stolpii]|uniref:SpoVR family protein n=1 Tax=Bacteriovorax stolpii TaxID=960 RepID=A0A2K9NRN7_BACTC|nr:SpoVR family protein [Bacteriovorax stolpii]AUN98173.1 SpoVR family protein [Bacteriovorax stolpii]QDK41846.1 SpoVR family protein [Bacteriovorax stolpii]TDP52090.1 stage V sporulation protein R [Bacteriovorax stolpii]